MDYLVLPEMTAGVFDASGTIFVDVACRRCGYNLRGLKPDGLCPECGTPIGLSISGDLLRFADPAWLEKLALGIRYILWGLAVAVLFGILGGVVGAFLNPALGQALGFVGGLLALYGTWLLTAPDPSGIGEDRYANSRKVIRLALLIGLLGNLTSMLMEAGGIPEWMRILLALVGVFAGVIWVVGEFAKLMYLEKLAMRIPEAQYAQRARFLRWAYGISLLLVIVLTALIVPITVAGGPGGGGAVAGLGCFFPVVAIFMLVFFLMYLRLLYRMGKAFRMQAQYARETWAKAKAAATG